MTAVLTQSNSFQLTGRIGRRPSDAELYMAHFLGLGGAAKLITAAEDKPDANAARMFPAAAAANRPIFYDRSGYARSVSEVYSVLATRYAHAANSPATRTALALYGDTPDNLRMASTAPAASIAAASNTGHAVYPSSFPQAEPATPVTLASVEGQSSTSANADRMFRSLFQVDDRSQPVSTTVRELWGRSSSLTADSAANLDAHAPRPLDLFSDRSGAFSS
jgi:hypothetical protein